VQDEWRASRGFVEELDWRRQLETLAETQQRNRKLAASRNGMSTEDLEMEDTRPGRGHEE
jgi:GTP-binding protein Era